MTATTSPRWCSQTARRSRLKEMTGGHHRQAARSARTTHPGAAHREGLALQPRCARALCDWKDPCAPFQSFLLTYQTLNATLVGCLGEPLTCRCIAQMPFLETDLAADQLACWCWCWCWWALFPRGSWLFGAIGCPACVPCVFYFIFDMNQKKLFRSVLCGGGSAAMQTSWLWRRRASPGTGLERCARRPVPRAHLV